MIAAQQLAVVTPLGCFLSRPVPALLPLSFPGAHGVYTDVRLRVVFSFLCEVSKSVSTAEQQLWKKSFSCFEKGIHNFESIDDATNAALLLCNTGRLMRICAQAHCGAGDEFKREFSPEEGLYYNKVTHLLPCRTSSASTESALSFAVAPGKYNTSNESCGDGV